MVDRRLNKTENENKELVKKKKTTGPKVMLLRKNFSIIVSFKTELD